jgi:sugar phosphate isomerase/epimerase
MTDSLNRRNFMMLAGTGLGALSTAGAHAATEEGVVSSPSPSGTMKLGMVTYNMGKDMSCEELIALCKKTGMSGVELRTTHAHGVEITLTAAERAQVRTLFEDSGIEICGIGTACEYHSSDPAEVEAQIRESIEFCQLAADIGAPAIKVRPNGVPKGEEVEKVLERIGRSWGRVAKASADMGVEVRMEVHGPEPTRSLANMRKMLDYADEPNATVCWNSNGGEEDEHGRIKPAFDLVKHAIGQVHINEIGVYQYPWQELFSLLQDSGFTGYCLAEIQYNEQPERFMRYYKTLFDLYTGQYRYPNPGIYGDK